MAAGKKVSIDAPVVLWNEKGGFVCPNKRGRQGLTQHDPALNDAPTQAESQYKILDPARAYRELTKKVHQLVLHYDVCYSSHHCHQIMKASPFKGSHFYLDLDGTLYQTCDLYWKTNTAPGDDGGGNERAVHVEIANLAGEALAEDSELYATEKDLYRLKRGRWELDLPEKYRKKLRDPDYKPRPARAWGERGYFSRLINGERVRMWDFTEEQYQTLIALCRGVHQLLPRVELKVPYNEKRRRTPLGKIKNPEKFCGVLGHAHVQSGSGGGTAMKKHDPGSAFDWGRLRQAARRRGK